jgi:hypothetical protein
VSCESDASADVPRDATEDAHPAPWHRQDGDAERLADQVRDVPELDAPWFLLAQLVEPDEPEPDTPDEVPYEERSCAAMALVDAVVQSEPRASLPMELLVEARREAQLQMSERPLALREASQD